MTRLALLLLAAIGAAGSPLPEPATAQPGPASITPKGPVSETRAAQGGAELFVGRCGYCHLAGGTGSMMMLARRLGKYRALIAERSDLQADYVRAVVRNGLNSMPALTRVEVPDDQLARIAAYLAHDSRAEKGRSGKGARR